MRYLIGVFSLFFLYLRVQSQQIIYKTYGVKDGLASGTVYYSFQDSRGFLWFGTDQGLCRFDGSNFKTYTTADGLPDNEVFNVKEDSLGRLWVIGYNSRPCFIYNGVIHNSENDTLLKDVDAESQFFLDVEVDGKGRVWILGQKSYLIDDYRVLKFNSPDGMACCRMGYIRSNIYIMTSLGMYQVDEQGDSLRFLLVAKLDGRNNSVPAFIGDACYLFQKGDKEGDALVKITKDTICRVNFAPLGITQIVAGHSIRRNDTVLLLSAGLQGIKAFNLDFRLLPSPYPFLPSNVTYTSTLFDKDGNTWIASLGKGVFFIPYHKTIRYPVGNGALEPVANSVYKSSLTNRVYVGFDNSGYAYLQNGKLAMQQVVSKSNGEKRTVRLCRLDNEYILAGSDYGIFLIPEERPSSYQFLTGTCVKNVISEGTDSVLVGAMTQPQRLILSGDKRFRVEPLWNQRTTAIAKDLQGRIWLGGLTGLHIWQSGRVIPFSANSAINKSRITDLLCDEYGNIWVATHQRGLFVISGDSIYPINTRSGLPGDVCVRLFREADGIMWLCTNRHVVRIGYSRNSSLAFDVSSMGDLTGNGDVTVNDVYVDSSHIWIASSIGLLQVEKFNRQGDMAPPVYITSFRTADSLFYNTDNIQLNHRQNNIQIDYVGVSYNSGGKLLYKYLLQGDTVFTTNTSLSLDALPPGEYRLQVWARNVAGLWSKQPMVLQFAIMPPFWLTGWFIALCLLGVVAAIVFFVRLRINQVKKREQEKTEFNRRIAETELQAMRAQMNEHFVFNSLNSIQNYINQNDTEAANYYLSNFGKLIRRTLDMSSSTLITLKEEIEYLQTYLLLEKMRFDQKFDFSVTNLITSVPPERLNFPSMILQPYVENAVRHGLRALDIANGRLSVAFTEEEGFIVCRIDDNGIGRKRAEELKSGRVVQHRSKGIKLSEDKVYLFNRIHDQKIGVEITDKINDNGEAAGTLVTVKVPLSLVA